VRDATANTYVVTALDVAHFLCVTVVPSDAGGAELRAATAMSPLIEVHLSVL
jgi:hypothetical protein